MEQIRKLLAGLTLRQKIITAVAAAAALAGLTALVRLQRERDFAVLYSNLSAEDASAVVGRLKESGVDYRLSSDSTTVRVRSAQVPDLRLQMAAAGIPKAGRIGYELFDRNNFGATEFTEHINYQRALEGEMERTVMTIAEVEHARVHITPAKDSVFANERRPAKASVLIRLRPGRTLSPANVKAVMHLVSSAVDGLLPEDVAVLDVHGNLLTRAKLPQGAHEQEMLNESLLAYRRSVEKDLLAKLSQTLEPLLGPERFRAAVWVECDLSTSEQSEETFDPTRSVMTASQRSEDLSNPAVPAGVPGVASNLPRPTSRPSSSSQPLTRRTENINYQSSRVIRRLQTPQGNIRRVSASVLLDHVVRFEGSGPARRRIVESLPPERIKAIRDLAAGAIGFQPERGDQIIVESIPFETTLSWQPQPAPDAPAAGAPRAPRANPVAWLEEGVRKKDPLVIGLLGGGFAVAVLVSVSVMLLRKRRKRRATGERLAEAGKSVEAGDPGALTDGKLQLPSTDLDKKFEEQFASQIEEKRRKQEEQDREILTSLSMNLKLPSATTRKAEVLGRHLGEHAAKSPEALAQIVRTWISDEGS